jgi:hypothetical protein
MPKGDNDAEMLRAPRRLLASVRMHGLYLRRVT